MTELTYLYLCKNLITECLPKSEEHEESRWVAPSLLLRPALWIRRVTQEYLWNLSELENSNKAIENVAEKHLLKGQEVKAHRPVKNVQLQ